MAAHPRLILASTSRYRAELLQRLGLSFSTQAPGTDESATGKETALQLAQRLALSKANAVAAAHPDAWVIGSDQVARCAGQLLGKPGSREAAIAQLQLMQGEYTAFITAVALAQQSSGKCLQAYDTTVVKMRRLKLSEIERYVDAEPAFDCAGSAKIEGLGISLCAEVQSRDPTALIGLPLIATAKMLRKAGFALP